MISTFNFSVMKVYKRVIAPSITADLIWLEIPLLNLKPIGASEEINGIGS